MRIEKISLPAAGLFARNLRDSVDGAHAVSRSERLAAFSHPRNPKISKIAFGLDYVGERNFLYFAEKPAASGRTGFAITRNLTRRRWKADSPTTSSGGEWRKDSNDGSFRFLARNPLRPRRWASRQMFGGDFVDGGFV